MIQNVYIYLLHSLQRILWPLKVDVNCIYNKYFKHFLISQLLYIYIYMYIIYIYVKHVNRFQQNMFVCIYL